MRINELVYEHLQALGIGIVLFFPIFLIAQRFNFFTMPKQENPSPAIHLNQVMTAFGIYITVQLFFVPLIWLFFIWMKEGRLPVANDLSMGFETQGWFNVISILLASLSIVLFFLFVRRDHNMMLWQGRKNGVFHRAKDFLIGVMTWLLAYPSVLIVGQIVAIIVLLEFQGPRIDQVAVQQLKLIEKDPFLFVLTGSLIILVIPAVEEFLFRGLLQTWMRSNFGSFYAVILTSAIFALFHYSSSQGNANWELLISLFVLACYLGYLFERQRSLWAPYGLHAAFNCISVILISLTE